jgi:hypothetical protein
MSEVHIEIDDRRSQPPSPFAAGAVEDLLAILAKAAGQVQASSALQARAAVEALSGDEAAQTLADLRAALAASR